MLKKRSKRKSKSTQYTGLTFDMNILSHQNDNDKGGIPFYTQESSDSIDRKDSIQLTQMVVTTNQNNINVKDPSLANKEVLDNTLIHIVMFMS